MTAVPFILPERLKAIEEHLDHMRLLEQKQLPYDPIPREVKYYVVEAEFWLQEARKED